MNKRVNIRIIFGALTIIMIFIVIELFINVRVYKEYDFIAVHNIDTVKIVNQESDNIVKGIALSWSDVINGYKKNDILKNTHRIQIFSNTGDDTKDVFARIGEVAQYMHDTSKIYLMWKPSIKYSLSFSENGYLNMYYKIPKWDTPVASMQERMIMIDSMPVNEGTIYMIDDIILNENEETSVSMDAARGVIREYKMSETNINQESSFESGTWRGYSWDCSGDKEGHVVSVRQVTEGTDGMYALELSSLRGNACDAVEYNILLDENSLYRFDFDYKSVSGMNIQYGLALSDDAGAEYVVSDKFTVNNNEWNTERVLIPPNLGFVPSKIVIHLYSPSTDGESNVVFYDNVRIAKFDMMKQYELNIDYKNQYKIQDLSKIKSGQLKDIALAPLEDNLLNEDVASFKNDIWQNDVWDCSSDKEGHNISMEYTDEGALRLASAPGHACTTHTFNTNLDYSTRYKLSFDYKGDIGDVARINYSFVDVNGVYDAYSEKILIESRHEWKTFEKIISSKKINIKKINIHFYADASSGEKNIVDYDNVRLVEWLPKDIDSYYLYVEQEVDESPSLASVEYKGVNRWKNRVVLHGVNRSFLLAYPERYSEKWKTYPVKSHKVKSREMPSSYVVPEIESNRQATKDEVEEFVNKNLISAVGKKFISKNFDDAIRNDNLDNGWWGETLFKSVIPEDTHYQINNYGNSWWVDIDKICQTGNQKVEVKNSKGQCIQNDDGTYDIELVIEHKFNRYANIMLLMSGSLFVILSGYLGYDFVRSKRRRGRGDSRFSVKL